MEGKICLSGACELYRLCNLTQVRDFCVNDAEPFDDSAETFQSVCHIWRSLCVCRNRHWFRVRFEVFAAVTMKNVVFWDIETHFVPHRRHFSL
jgi:hypothetical protein